MWANVEGALGTPEGRDEIIARIIQLYQASPVEIARRLNAMRAAGQGSGTALDPETARRLAALEEVNASQAREANAQQVAAWRHPAGVVRSW